MKVLKFGGTSVGSPDSICNLRTIVLQAVEPVTVVVSALGGVTDSLITLSSTAAEGDPGYEDLFEALVRRHHDMVEAVVPSAARPKLLGTINTLLTELRSILHGVYLIQDLTPKTSDVVVSYGERLSAPIVATLFGEKARLLDSRELIRTHRRESGHVVDFSLTNAAISAAFAEAVAPVTVMGGFIASDADTHTTTNLGRGGSDYTAAIVAAALGAGSLEIWTDVDGFLTADPRIIKGAITIPQLSYAEAMELCNFGAKVVYPPTIYPAYRRNIPIYVRNTFRPASPGTVISAEAARGERPVRGISSVAETSLVTVSGPSMVGVIGVNHRIFTTLAVGGISVFMVAQNSSETSTTLCLTPPDAPRACRLLDTEFSAEIASGAMNPARLTEDMASVAVVGERMKDNPGIAGKLFTVLGNNGISIAAIAMGGQEINLSFVIERKLLHKTLGVLHDSFFLSEHEDLNLFVCGTGTVGSSLLRQIADRREALFSERGLRLNLIGVSGRSQAAFSREGIDPAAYRKAMEESREAGGAASMVEEIERMNIPNSVFVDCTASSEPASLYERLLSCNVSVVAANKIAASAPYAHYLHLKQIARERGVKFLFETNVGAGLPIISTIGDLTASGDRILGIEAVLSGTLNFVFNALSSTVSLSQAVKMAQEQGYSEPDPRVDLSGVDVVRKLVILVRESGYAIETDEVKRQLFIPSHLFEGSLEDFWVQLPTLDAQFEADRCRLLDEGKRRRFVARWKDGCASVALEEFPVGHPFYNLEASNNILLLHTERYHDYPMLIQGYGAGAEVTAAGVFADIMRCR